MAGHTCTDSASRIRISVASTAAKPHRSIPCTDCAHNAPLGIRFLHGPVLPTGYERVALVALHGSWNRSTLDGYKVVSLHWLTDGTVVEKDFLTGFLGPDGVIGRPAGIAQGPDGTIFVSDDYAGAIYRISPDMPDEDVETVPPGSP
jgi:glucose/arabinose dehydrogenase